PQHLGQHIHPEPPAFGLQIHPDSESSHAMSTTCRARGADSRTSRRRHSSLYLAYTLTQRTHETQSHPATETRDWRQGEEDEEHVLAKGSRVLSLGDRA